ncbi:hypothetical protein NDU88_005011 [Pleurodeles waltl]|uniref:Uncharacterized protein n=1 Tax=Pleurodeles waltl TaxID=8319 RepID=A0AAV7L317_PLEWA|nr:hypothetical protein NDU88_005011 [Pleurodeles waltl]
MRQHFTTRRLLRQAHRHIRPPEVTAKSAVSGLLRLTPDEPGVTEARGVCGWLGRCRQACSWNNRQRVKRREEGGPRRASLGYQSGPHRAQGRV